MQKSKYDLIVFGATGFVGQILARYLIEQIGCTDSPSSTVKWAIAARSESKLKALRQSLGEVAATLPLIVADALEESSLRDLCDQTRLVVSTAGPYAIHGSLLVEICVQTGTDYCDLTAEVQWIRRMMTQYESAAKLSGARIVHCCGFDSIPSDMGVLFLQQYAWRRFKKPCTEVKMRVRSVRGGVSGGTFASLLNILREALANPVLRAQLKDPYILCPQSTSIRPKQHTILLAEYDADFNKWVAPFVMSVINERIVLRSNALSASEYNPFFYNEAVLTGSGFKGRLLAQMLSLGLGSFVAVSSIAPLRLLMEKFILPESGKGPSEKMQREGYFDIRFLGKTNDGRVLKVKVTGDCDPGYRSTAKMLGQTALSLVQDVALTTKPGGFWTTASLFGERLIERLQDSAGLSFTVLDD